MNNSINKTFLKGILIMSLAIAGTAKAQVKTVYSKKELTDAALVKKLPGFKNGEKTVNGVKLHYVTGGHGAPLVLLPGWPQTWWSFHKMMPQLAEKYTVIVVDIRGMGSSGRPTIGYEKKNMAKDIAELVQALGYQKAFIAGHDIGAQVAFSVAENYPDLTEKLVMIDVPHPDENFAAIPMLPPVGTPTEKMDANKPYLWWFAFNQLKELPTTLLTGRFRTIVDADFKYLLLDKKNINEFDREVYAAAYDSPGGIQAGNAWYQAFPQDIVDYKTYGKINMPVLGLGGAFFGFLNYVLPNKTTNLKMVQIADGGHFIPDEKPKEAADDIINFLK